MRTLFTLLICLAVTGTTLLAREQRFIEERSSWSSTYRPARDMEMVLTAPQPSQLRENAVSRSLRPSDEARQFESAIPARPVQNFRRGGTYALQFNSPIAPNISNAPYRAELHHQKQKAPPALPAEADAEPDLAEYWIGSSMPVPTTLRLAQALPAESESSSYSPNHGMTVMQRGLVNAYNQRLMQLENELARGIITPDAYLVLRHQLNENYAKWIDTVP